jgi:hypothetical protein
MMQERCSLLMQKAKDLPLSSENLAITLELFIQRQQQNEQHIQQEIIGNSLIEPASISKDIIAIDPLAVIRHFLATSEPFINGQLCIKPVSLWKIDADERSPIQALDSLYLSNNLICNKTNLATHQKKLAAFAVFIKKDAHECVALGLSSEEMIDFLGALSEEDLQGVALFSLKGTSLTGRCKTHLIDQNFLQKLCFEGHIFNEDLKELAKEGQAARLWLEEGPQNSTDPVNLKPQTIENILLRPCYQKAKEILKSRLLPPYEEDLLQKEVERVERALIMINSGKESLAETEIRHLSKRSIQSLPVHLTPYIPCSMVPLLQTVEQIQRLSEKQLPYLSSKTLAEHYPDLEKTWSFIRNRSYAKRRSPQMQELQARLLPLSFKQMQSLVQALEAEEDEKTIAFSPAN